MPRPDPQQPGHRDAATPVPAPDVPTDADGTPKSEGLFSTDHLETDLRGRSVRGAAVTMVSQGVTFVLSMAGLAVLARLLGPAPFGLIAKVVAITGFVAIFKDSGLSMATVQRKDITHPQISTLFWFNVLLSITVAAVITALAPLLVWFYQDPAVLKITLAMAGVTLITGLGIQHRALLSRQMSFATLAGIDIAGLVVGMTAAIAAAFAGWGYWALAIQLAGGAVTQTLLLWVFCRWVPSGPRRGTGVGPMLAFGANLTGAQFLNYASRNVDNILIGRFGGDIALGFYNQAYKLLLLPIRQINSPMTAVAIPTLSRLQHDPERFKRYYFKAIGAITFVGMPIVAFLFVEAREVVLLVLGDQWLGAVPIFQALAPAAFLGTFNVAGGWVCTAIGRTDRQFRWQLVAAPVTVTAFVVGLPWGAYGVALVFSLSRLLLVAPGISYCYRASPVSLGGLLRTLTRPALSSLAAAAVLWILSDWLPKPPVMALASGLSIYLMLYLLVWIMLPGGWRELATISKTARGLRVTGYRPSTIKS